jgi:hypothetical protein
MRKGAIVSVLAVAALVLLVLPAGAALTGSNFEIDTNANLVVDGGAGSQDWASIPQGTTTGTERRQQDMATGANDNSFGQGTKEDSPVPTIVSGQIPNNKSDLKFFGGYLEENGNGKFLNIYWTRVQAPTGTTNMDFEFNKSSTLSANGVTPVRTAGDVLIQYDLAQGGTHPELFLSRWVTTGSKSQCQAANSVPCWGTRVNLSAAGDAVGSINTTAITAANADGLGALSARTFGEAQIDFDAFAGGSDACVSFGSAYLKSRSSDSFTAELKDFIAPIQLNFSNCGGIEITKVDDGDPATTLEGAEFDLRPDVAPLGTAPGNEDVTTDSCTTDATGVCSFSDLLQGDYWIVETVAPAGHDLASPAFQLVTVTADETATVTFVNPSQKGAIQVTKTAKHAAEDDGVIELEGVKFNIAGTDVVTDANGVACVDGLAFGDYDVTETEVPTGYAASGDLTKSVTVDNKATCDGDPYEGETVSFVNTPLTDVTVSVDSQIDGGTSSTILCDDPDATAGSTDATGDGSATAADLAPGTYSCTVVIDP